MKYLKMLGLAAVAAMALTAFLGASSASATVLCTTTTTPCGASWHIDHIEGSLVKGSSASLHSTGGGIEATCTESTITLTKDVTGSATTTAAMKFEAGESKWPSCSQTTDTIKGGTLEIHQISGTHNGTVTAKEAEVTVIIAGVSCTFGAGASTDLGTLTGGSPAILDINAVVNKTAGSFLCPSDSQWTATYQITNHTSAYVVKE